MMTDKTYSHQPVLTDEIVSFLSLKEDGVGRIIDGTVGYGGHSSLLLNKNAQAELLGIDRDGKALSSARKSLAFAHGRVHLFQGNFSNLKDFANRLGWHSVDRILLDLGISSPQIDDAARGFSHRLKGPLDMRMDTRSPITACCLLNKASVAELQQIFYRFGEIRRSRKLAEAIVARRKTKPWVTTDEFADLCEQVLGKSRPGKLPTPTLCFQAIRIAVNHELEELEMALDDALDLLVPKGRIAVISFHSLEDRIVKLKFREAATECICPPGLPLCRCDHKQILRLLTKKPVVPGEEEVKRNPRSSSAKLRVAEKL